MSGVMAPWSFVTSAASSTSWRMDIAFGQIVGPL